MTGYLLNIHSDLKLHYFKMVNKMNIKILLLLLTVSISCANSSDVKPKIIQENKSETELSYELTELLLEFETEKITLISISKGVPIEKTKTILQYYLSNKINSEILSNEDPEYFSNLIDTIAKQNSISKKLTASIIFNYQYGMNTDDNLTESDYNYYYED